MIASCGIKIHFDEILVLLGAKAWRVNERLMTEHARNRRIIITNITK